MRAHACRQRAVGVAAFHAQHQMHAARLGIDQHVLAQYGGEAVGGQLAALAVQAAHALDVAGEMAFVHEVGHDLLHQRGAAGRKVRLISSKRGTCAGGTTR
jgi:hypothetical protein